MKLWRIFNGLILLLAVALTLKEQSQWRTPSILSLFEITSWLWVIVLGPWAARLSSRHQERRPKTSVVPIGLALVIVCGATHLPLRALFWMHRSALTRAITRPPLRRQFPSKTPRIGWFVPLQISKSNGATRFILWENPDFLSGRAVGFAHCPRHDGCSSASFERFYWDSESAPDTLRVSDDWIAVSVYGSDM